MRRGGSETALEGLPARTVKSLHMELKAGACFLNPKPASAPAATPLQRPSPPRLPALQKIGYIRVRDLAMVSWLQVKMHLMQKTYFRTRWEDSGKLWNSPLPKNKRQSLRC